MGKSARRSTQDDPSSPSPYIYYHPSTSQPSTFQVWSPNDSVATSASTLGDSLRYVRSRRLFTQSLKATPRKKKWSEVVCFCWVNIYFNERHGNQILWRLKQRKKPQSEENLVNYLFPSILYILNSQIKSAENKTSSTAIPSPDHVSSSKPSTPTQKTLTTTYRSLTTTWKSQPTARGYTNFTRTSDKLTDAERLKLREDFFATYDVMTGIRIAATLGGFFFLMVFLIVYKSRSHSNKALRVRL